MDSMLDNLEFDAGNDDGAAGIDTAMVCPEEVPEAQASTAGEPAQVTVELQEGEGICCVCDKSFEDQFDVF